MNLRKLGAFSNFSLAVVVGSFGSGAVTITDVSDTNGTR
jgi:hypothetical protein